MSDKILIALQALAIVCITLIINVFITYTIAAASLYVLSSLMPHHMLLALAISLIMAAACYAGIIFNYKIEKHLPSRGLSIILAALRTLVVATITMLFSLSLIALFSSSWNGVILFTMSMVSFGYLLYNHKLREQIKEI